MRRDLAERLLAKVMGWSDAEKAAECVEVEALAKYKYDEYQQFAPGLHFIESLALWLRQFRTNEERKNAYRFVRSRLVFISESEINHLVQLVFPLFIRPHLIKRTANELTLLPNRVKFIANSLEFKLQLRRTLILGLSDGARTDRFRRSNWRDISNEQVCYSYDFSNAKAINLKKKLIEDVDKLTADGSDIDKSANHTFQTVVLLDDFTASGTSYLRGTDSDGWEGKIHKILSKLESTSNGSVALLSSNEVKVIVIIYVATPQAVSHLNKLIGKRKFSRGDLELHVVHNLGENQKLSSPNDDEILNLVNNDLYWDPTVDDEHAKVGSGSFRFGYADCMLPIILSHNSPNNTIFLLWAGEDSSIHGLFPRVSRHKRFE